MTQTEKQRLITEVVTLLQARLDAMTAVPVEPTPAPKPPKSPENLQAVEMLTIKECTECVRGLSAHTIRQLVKQGKLPSVRTGMGRNGKILVSKSALFAYLNENGGVA